VSKIVIRNARVLSMDTDIGDFASADILIDGSEIAAVGPDLGQLDAVELDGTDRIVTPGFVDTHRHTWQSLIRHISTDWTLPQYFSGVRGVLGNLYTPEDMYAANLVGAVEAVDAGITTLVDWSHNNNTPDHADAAIYGLADSGIRGVFAYGNSNDEWLPPSDVPHSRDIERIRNEHFSSDGLLTLAMALRGPQFTTPEVSQYDFSLAAELDLPVTVHVGDALWGLSRPLHWLDDNGHLRPDITYVHCNTIGDSEFDLIARSGGAISVAPELEMTMGHGLLATLRARERGIPLGISIDVCTSVGGDPFSAMRAILAGSRYEVNLQAIEDREVIETLPLLATDVLRIASSEGARVAWLGNQVGSLTPGKQADVVMVRTDVPPMVPLNFAAGAVVESGNPMLVDTVIIAGEIVKQDGRLTSVDFDHVRRLAEEARDSIIARAGIEDPGTWRPRPYTG
jgi:5-methylthioadenosine/S-adenosylhomocysteine deaminase